MRKENIIQNLLAVILPELPSSTFLESTPEHNQRNQHCLHSVDSAHMKKKYCHMDCFIDVLATFLCIDRGNIILSMEGQRALRFHQKYLHLCSEDLTGFERHQGE